MKAWFLFLLVLAIGAASSAAWMSGAQMPEPGPLALALAATCTLTTLNLAARWIRWHFLLRTFGIRLRARESTLVFASLLPTILTPWAVGELLLAVVLRRHTNRPLRAAAQVWLISRSADAVSVALLLILGRYELLGPVLAVVLLSSLALSAAERQRGPWNTAFRLYLFLGLSLLAWSFACAALFAVMSVLGASISFPKALEAFARGTLAGALSGAPGGIAVTGAAIIRSLIASQVPEPAAVWSVAALRGGTVGFAVALGLVTAWKFRRALREMAGGRMPASQGHFDDLAPAYAEEIPNHVRDRLVKTKSDVVRRILDRMRIEPGARGLDIGCGQGWYLTHLARQGYAMAGCDLTAGQIEEARTHAQTAGVSVDLRVAPAECLPYPDASFDFAYTINVLHHITDPDALRRALREVVRVLKPGAPLIVFEMNTLNPLFRFYMSYLFPFIRNIDDGTEVWLTPGRLPEVEGALWSREIDYITFVPDFVPRAMLGPLSRLEARLERSFLKRFSAHFAITLVKAT